MKLWWNQIKELKKKLEEMRREGIKWKERVEDVEMRVEKNFGIKVRYEKIVVNSDFSKVEMAVMLVGMERLLRESKNSDDTRFYVELRDKIQGLIDKMED